jgi:hypothetical protein
MSLLAFLIKGAINTAIINTYQCRKEMKSMENHFSNGNPDGPIITPFNHDQQEENNQYVYTLRKEFSEDTILRNGGMTAILMEIANKAKESEALRTMNIHIQRKRRDYTNTIFCPDGQSVVFRLSRCVVGAPQAIELNRIIDELSNKQ